MFELRLVQNDYVLGVGMSNIYKIRDAFAKSIFVKAMLIKYLELTNKENARINESINEDIKKYTDLIPPGKSKSADQKANNIGIELCKQGWHDQPKFDYKRQIFQFEHFYTVKLIREKCLKALSEEEIANVLDKYSKVIWILKDEDKKLTSLGYRSERENPIIAYEEAGIELQD
jgi:hypothetical protein